MKMLLGQFSFSQCFFAGCWLRLEERGGEGEASKRPPPYAGPAGTRAIEIAAAARAAERGGFCCFLPAHQRSAMLWRFCMCVYLCIHHCWL